MTLGRLCSQRRELFYIENRVKHYALGEAISRFCNFADVLSARSGLREGNFIPAQ